MDDLDALARDFGFGPRGKSNPMRSSSSQPDRRSPGSNSNYSSSNNYGNSGDGSKYAAMDGFDYDTVFNSTEKPDNAGGGGSSSRASSFPVYDKPVYDNDGGDMFDGLPGVKSKSGVRFEDDVFVSKSRHENSGFDDLLGNLGSSERGGESNKSRSARSGTSAKGFDDLLAGFGSGGSASSNNRQLPERNSGSVPYGGSKHESVLDDPFVVLGSSSAHASFSSSVYTDPLEEIGKSRSARAEVSSGGGGTFDDLDPLNSFGKPIDSFSPGRERKREDGSPSRSTTPQSATNRKLNENSSFRNSESNMEKKIPLDKFQEPPLFAAPNVSTDFQKSFGKNASSPEFYETDSEVDMSPTSEQEQHCDDIWLSVSEIPLFTQPTAAPPPSRPPPPKPRQSSRPGVGSFSSGSRKKGSEFSSPKSYSQYSQDSMPSRSTAKGPLVTQLDKLEDFAQGGPQHIFDESANLHSSEDTNAFSAAAAAAASAAAMKEVMDKAEAKFRHAKEVREREYAKASRNKEPDRQDREFWETERKQKEEEERAERRLERERERSREIEREKGRQAVERATREARERAVTGAHERATAEARVKSERAAVEKANAEARARAERVAVQRAQAEARERAAADAKDRAERAAAAESRDKAAALRAGAESRRRSERAAVERATAEARERAAVEARERASTAAKVNQPRTEDDLESFFSMGRASSAPRPRSNPTNPFFDQQFQNQGGFQGAQKTSASSGPPPNMKKASSTTNIVDDLSSIFGAAPSSGEFQEVEGETEGRRRARLDRNQRTQERAAKALAEKNQRDLQAQRDQEERHRISETLDFEIKRWAAGKEGNLRALLSTLQYVLWPECGWQPVSLTDLIAGASVKKVYRKATLCIHPDKVQQKGATLQQKYIAEKVFDLLKEAWNKFNSEELF